MKTPLCPAVACLLAGGANSFAGDLTARYELTLNRALRGGPPVYSDAFVLADLVPQHQRRFTEFSGDVSGRYVGALAIAAEFSRRNFPSAIERGAIERG